MAAVDVAEAIFTSWKALREMPRAASRDITLVIYFLVRIPILKSLNSPKIVPLGEHQPLNT